MEDDKLEVVLNAALTATEEELEKSELLSAGYDRISNQWTLIIRYNGDSSEIEKLSDDFKVLYGGYGIVKISKDRIQELSELPEVLYIEKPKNIYFEERSASGAILLPTGIEDICINSLRDGDANLYGEGVVIAVIDSSIDFSHPSFVDTEGRTRIIEIYDQNTGVHLSEEEINEALFNGDISPQLREKINSVRDISGHGTAVAGICAGNYATNKNNNIGIATKSKLLVVKLGTPGENNFPRTTELMEAIDYAVKKSIELNVPMVINISFGNSYGSHDGTSLLETFIDDVSGQGKIAIVVGSGNEGAAGGHFAGRVSEGGTESVELFIGVYESGLDVQLWKNYVDIFTMEIIGPSGMSTGIISEENGTVSKSFEIDGTEIMIYWGKPGPYSIYQELYIGFTSLGDYITEGIWQINITGKKVTEGSFDMWLPVSGSLNGITSFGRPSPEVTLTIPSTASKVITVGAYDSFTNSYADFSGRGYTRMTNQIKPDIVAPGVDIVTAKAGGGLASRTGTSMATPFVTGGVALLMEWGIVKGNDPYLYGEKVKAYLIRGAVKLPGINEYPDTKVAWGRLCVAGSIPSRYLYDI